VQRQRVSFGRSAMLVAAAVSAVLGASTEAMAQALKDIQVDDKPLVLKAQGSFFVGGDKVEQTAGELGDLGPGSCRPRAVSS
jgi:hypothetical protein